MARDHDQRRAGGRARCLGTLTRAGGTAQVTWAGKPLYFFSSEGLAPAPTGVRATGNGITLNGGTFRLVRA